jgi:hypothetical protein
MNKLDHKRCFVFGYQVSIHIVDMMPMLKPQPFAKIKFNAMNSRMLILPGDRLGIRFGSKDTPYEAIRMQPDIHDPKLPAPFDKRYQITENGKTVVRLPCNDVMIADSMQCRDTIIYCRSADDEFKFSIQGAGEIFTFNQRCGDFLSGFNWDTETRLLRTSIEDFKTKYDG